jgi:ubiquinone/menaquinone biosynthesis C-methylase UbiE
MAGSNGSVLLALVLLVTLQGGGQAALVQRGTGDRAREAKREKDQRVGDIFTAMGVKPGAVVADIGAGEGFFTVRLSEAVGAEGRVLAVDISASVLRSLRARVEREGLANVEVVEGTTSDPRLPEAALDAALIVNAYHEMTEHQAMLEHIRKALKPGGRLVIVEPISAERRDSTRDEQTRRHEIAPGFVEQDAKSAGYEVAALEDPFSSHHGHGSEYMIVLTRSGGAASAREEDMRPRAPRTPGSSLLAEPSIFRLRAPGARPRRSAER